MEESWGSRDIQRGTTSTHSQKSNDCEEDFSLGFFFAQSSVSGTVTLLKRDDDNTTQKSVLMLVCIPHCFFSQTTSAIEKRTRQLPPQRESLIKKRNVKLTVHLSLAKSPLKSSRLCFWMNGGSCRKPGERLLHKKRNRFFVLSSLKTLTEQGRNFSKCGCNTLL